LETILSEAKVVILDKQVSTSGVMPYLNLHPNLSEKADSLDQKAKSANK
jgi:hypothetical protein